MSECWELSSACRIDWDAVAGVSTALTLFGGVCVYVIDRIKGWRAAKARRRVIASVLLHTVGLTRNHLRATAVALANPAHSVERAVEFGKALKHHDGKQLSQRLADIADFGTRTSSDLAYAVALIDSIDSFADWLSSGDATPENADQIATIRNSSEFFAEAARQAVESLDAVEAELMAQVPAHIRLRRFGPVG